MTGTLAVGSDDDLEPDPAQPIDRTPTLTCTICGENHPWQDYCTDRFGWDRFKRNETEFIERTSLQTD